MTVQTVCYHYLHKSVNINKAVRSISTHSDWAPN